MKSVPASLGIHLQRLRRSVGLTLREVDALSKSFPAPIAYDYLCRVEGGQAIPSAEKLITLARIYGVTPQKLFEVIEQEHWKAAAPETRDPEECRALGIEYLLGGEFHRAFACFQKGLTLLEADGGSDPVEIAERVSRMRNNIALALIRLGRFSAAQQEAERSLENRQISDDSAVRALSHLAVVAYQRDQLPLADMLARGCVEMARPLQDRDLTSRCLTILANVWHDKGEVDRARDAFIEIIALYDGDDGDDDNETVLVARGNLGECYFRLKQLTEAENVLEKGLFSARRHPNTKLAAQILVTLGKVRNANGERREAKASLTEARAICAGRDYRLEGFSSTYYLWRMALEEREGAEAVELFKALKRLRLKLDQRSEEVVLFDAYLDEVRTRKRQKGAHHGKKVRSKSRPSRRTARRGNRC